MDPDILVSGEALIDFLPDRPGPLAEVDGFVRRPGGAPANVAVGLARLDEIPWFWTRVGDDPFGDFLRGTLASAGLPDRFVERDPDAKTMLAFVTHDDDGEPAFAFYRDGTAAARMAPGAVPDAVLDGVDWVYASGVQLPGGPSREATFDLAERAADRACTVVLDPNARPELWDGADHAFGTSVDRLLPHVDLVKAAVGDLREVGFEGSDPEALARAVCDRGPHTVLVTRGAAGAFAYATDAAPWGPATATHDGYAVAAVDTTGAGDAFLAGALASLAGGERSLDAVLAFANAVAALATTGEGGMAALPDRDAVRAFRRER